MKKIILIGSTIGVFALCAAIILVILGVPFGALLWLAGGPDEVGVGLPGFVLYILWPCAIVALLVALAVDATMARHAIRLRNESDSDINPKSQQSSQVPHIFFRFGMMSTALTVFYFFPILMNGMSHLAYALSFDELSEVLHKWRWLSQGAMIAAVIAVVCIIAVQNLIAFGWAKIERALTNWLKNRSGDSGPLRV